MVKRKLTTVFCADVQQYGKMMARDEAGTLDRLRRYRSIMEKLFDKRDGRKVNTWGDAVIAEFISVVEAVRCAVEIQEAISSENRDLPDADQMWFRIGINLGDVMEDNGDIYGDGVNMASRLESLAEPGGIMVSQSVYNFTHRQLAIGYDFAGEQRGKDDDQPFASYRVRMGGQNSQQEEQLQQAQAQTAFVHHAAPDQDKGEKTPVAKLDEAVEKFRDWFSGQNKKVRFSVMMIGFFFAINLLFSGIATPWFIFPSFPFAMMIVMNMRADRKRKKEEGETNGGSATSN